MPASGTFRVRSDTMSADINTPDPCAATDPHRPKLAYHQPAPGALAEIIIAMLAAVPVLA